VTAGGLLLLPAGDPMAIAALDAKTGRRCGKFQTCFAPMRQQCLMKSTATIQLHCPPAVTRSRQRFYVTAVWACSLKGQLGPLWPPTSAANHQCRARAERLPRASTKVKIADNNVEYSLLAVAMRSSGDDRDFLSRCRRFRTQANAFDKGKVMYWDTGRSGQRREKAITFSEPASLAIIAQPRTLGCTVSHTITQPRPRSPPLRTMCADRLGDAAVPYPQSAATPTRRLGHHKTP